jgi:hypothetical protein
MKIYRIDSKHQTDSEENRPSQKSVFTLYTKINMDEDNYKTFTLSLITEKYF